MGTGAALRMAGEGNADAVLVHAPEAEAPYVASGDLIGGRLVMTNDFIIVGPRDDPAAAASAPDLPAALAAIAAGGRFVSRGDDSGTHKKELALWAGAGIDPTAVPREETGQGMGATLTIASERRAYTLTDRATYLALREVLDLAVLVEGEDRPPQRLPRLRRQPRPPRWRRRDAGGGLRRLPRGPEDAGAHRPLPRRGVRTLPLHPRCRVPHRRRVMAAIWDGLIEALRLIGTGDGALYSIAGRSLLVSGSATALAMVVGVPLGYLLGRARFPARTLILAAVGTGMGMPPVVAGLVIWLLLVRSGPFGSFELIYTKQAMIIAQFLIATPLVIAFTAASIQALPARLPDLLTVLGAGRLRSLWLLAREARLGLLAAVMAGFGAVVSEVGASMAVGGNLVGDTRVLTTAIVTETSRADTERAIAYGLVLLAMAFAIVAVLTVVQQRGAR